MRIVSSFKDYYDTVGFDFGELNKTYQEKVYLRTTEKVQILDRLKAYKNRTLNWSGPSGDCLFVCGKAYPVLYESELLFLDRHNCGLKNPKDLNENEKKELKKTWFSMEEYEMDNKPDKLEKFKNKRYYKSYCNEFEEDRKQDQIFFDYLKGKDVTKFHVQYDCPILFAHYSGGNLFYVIKNPCLQEFGFAKVMPPTAIFQEIELFLGNVLVKDSMPPSHQSDIGKIISHGFDPKSSFRKPKNIEQ